MRAHGLSIGIVNSTRIKRLRKRLNMSQPELAAAIGVTKLTVFRWEHGGHTPHPVFAEKLKELERAAREKVAAR